MQTCAAGAASGLMVASGPRDLEVRVLPSGSLLLRPAVDLEDTVDEIKDPVLWYPSTRIELALEPSVESEAPVGHFDYQGGLHRVSVDSVAR